MDAAAAAPPRRPLTFDERVSFQGAIEQVYDRHRIWPRGNPVPKPPFGERLPPAALRAKVEDYLKKSDALEALWHRPVTGEQLQAEMDRMVRGTQDGPMLAELFAALDDDPHVIAECLARPLLVDRQIRRWYARDSRFHEEVEAAAECALAGVTTVDEMRARDGLDTGARYEEIEWHKGHSAPDRSDPIQEGTLRVPDEQWEEWVGKHAEAFAREPAAARLRQIPLGRVSTLQEDDERFWVSAVVSQGADRMRVASLEWQKVPFDAWWREARVHRKVSLRAPPSDGYTTPAMAGRLAPCAVDAWATVNRQPVARDGHTAVWTGSEMIVWGGIFQGSTYLDTGGRYDPATDYWVSTSTGPNVPSARRSHTAVWTGTEMIVWGGEEYGGTAADTGARYDPVADSWVPTSAGANVPAGRVRHTAVWTGVEMIIWGGLGGSFPLDTGGRYDPVADSWQPTSTGTNVPAARYDITAVWTGNVMVIWGGQRTSTSLDTGGRYDPSTDSWLPTSTGANVPSARSGHVAVWTGSVMVVWGGAQGVNTNLDTGGRYDPSTDSWAPTSTGANVPSARSGHAAVWTGNAMVIWGGWDGSSYPSTGGRYDPSTNSWLPTSTGADVPVGRDVPTAVWTGGEMIVWGGRGTGSDAGARYDPATDTWVATYVVPSSRAFHTAVWTGSEMIVWGGLGTVGPRFPTAGGRYDPATDSWAPTSTGPNVPPGRSMHTAVWTGSQMILWGGRDFSYVDTGGRYDPSTDSWSPISTGANVPTARYQHTAVWTGGEMIVWGGSNGPPLGSGGRYDPVTDAWSPTSTGTSVPTARYWHTAVWTGGEMIVWGGYYGSPLDTGGRYDPSTDSWLPTGTGANVPSARSGHTTVWTGNEMVVWGGYYGSPLDTGSRYDPSTDSWSPTSTGANVPSARSGHTTVWTGNEMVVWGGTDAGGRVNTGGRYGPTVDAWVPTSTGANVPTPRGAHTAVWAGDEMIVWGGSDDTGARYCVCPSIALSPWTLPGGVVGQAYSHTITASGGTAPYTFAITAGGLPPGLGLSSGGILSGTPAAAGSFSFTVGATDVSSCTGVRAYRVTVFLPACGTITIAPATLPAGDEGLPYAQTLTATGGTAPYTWVVTAGTLPPGLALGAASGLLGGTPTLAGSYGFTITATDGSASACTGSAAYVIDVAVAVDHVLGEGLGPTNGNGVKVYTRDGTAATTSFSAYSAGQWGTNVSSANVNGATYREILTAPGPGAVYGPHVRGWLRSGTPIPKVSFYAYATLRYGANVGGGGVDGDSFDEILTGPGPGEVFGPHVRAFDFDNATLAAIAKVNFFAYGTLQYGVNVEEGSVDTDGFAEILTGAGPGAAFAATVRGFNYDAASLTAIAKINFNAFPTTYGVNVAGGDADGDGYAEIAAAQGPAPVNTNSFAGFDFDGLAIAPAPGFTVTPTPGSLFGGRLGTADVTGDDRAELQCGAGRDPAVGSTVSVYRYTGSSLVAVPPSFTPFSSTGYANGVNVAGGGLGYY